MYVYEPFLDAVITSLAAASSPAGGAVTKEISLNKGFKLPQMTIHVVILGVRVEAEDYELVP